ncbi:MAG: hypothetical protein MI802_13880 [Desulfobacterales bacterium]|nr:hypothetical protein [Desulfobacterales bacterium]
MDKLGEFKNQLYHFMTNLSKENPSSDKLARMLKLMGQMEDVLYEIKKPTIDELKKDTGKIIDRLRKEAEAEAEAAEAEENVPAEAVE